MARPSFDDYFMRLAYMASTRATCDRKHVGAVIVSPSRRVVSTGYNGAPSGLPSCDEAGHHLVDGHCVRTIHSEANAISFAGHFAAGCSIYCTCIPCWDCAKLIVNVGITHVYYDEFYPSRYGLSESVPAYFSSAGVKAIQYDSAMLSAFKKKLAELDTLENEVLRHRLVEYACGCVKPWLEARERCPEHQAEKVHE